MPGIPNKQIIFFYQFVQGSEVYRVCTNPVDVEYDGFTWLSYPIKHSTVNEATDPKKSTLKITFPLNTELSSLFRQGSLDVPMTMTLFKYEVGNVSAEVFWKGNISSYNYKNKEITLNAESLLIMLRRTALRGRFQKTCRHDLYGVMCKVDRSSYEVIAQVTSKNGLKLTLSGIGDKPDGYFKNGIVATSSGTLRTIESHNGNEITLLKSDNRTDYTNLPVDVVLYPGCDKTVATCKNKFDNLLNNGGFKFIPNKNPMNGSSII